MKCWLDKGSRLVAARGRPLMMRRLTLKKPSRQAGKPFYEARSGCPRPDGEAQD